MEIMKVHGKKESNLGGIETVYGKYKQNNNNNSNFEIENPEYE